MKILGAYGLIDMSPIEISQHLKDLNMSHTCVSRQGIRLWSYDVATPTKEQPVWPVVVDSVRSLSNLDRALNWRPSRIVVFVTDARAALCQTNISSQLWPENRLLFDIKQDLKHVLKSAHRDDFEWELKIKNPTIMDYVNTAVKPSFLNDLGTLFYKISNYQQRKEIQKLCIGYLASSTPKNKMLSALKANLKFEAILNLMTSDKAQELKDAVAQLKTDPVDVVANRTGLATFELLYVSKSAANSKDTK